MNDTQPRDPRMARRAAFGSFLGSVVEYYDFFIYGSAAALVFSKLFFPSTDPMAGTLAALATFGVGYIARPVGALLFGHLGDRIGRKQVLMMTLLLMGLATTLIGLLPTHASIGAWAPALLVLCRLLQGLSAGGEQVGASLLTMEHAPGQKKAFYTSWLINGASMGSILATSVFIPLSLLSEEQLLAWGWRIPFLLSALMVAGTWIIRRGVDESPEFAAQKSEPQHAPVVEMFSKESRAFVTVFCCALICAVSSLVMIFGLSWASNNNGVDRASMLSAIAASQVVALICQPLFGLLADRIGKKRIFVIGSLACCAGVFLFLWSITTGHIALIVLATVLLKGILYSAPNALWPSFYAEMFSIRVRYTGVGLATQLSFIVSGFSPSLCYALLRQDGGWLPVACFIGGLALIAGIAAMLSRPASDSARAAGSATALPHH
ncbi:MFS transporter [Pseudomonas sp. DTU_2021_1001937_2_SI_NGA_ILE_001]|uniref:MFS transporter n=1 Tax=Pseudomonas sp. DTU_2021_1001937_2_SI_NGA_ILE_001 TaxID=3077589 RepID=UPI0028FC299D|nr:MFS transporter [Pseudomonas sp. DTU_2021_1001937_2_SI_NGA_ILE_001]WNW11589.1 MFS transporter [Pseudomonas sp. DTU_2021_1001937_2_SI_NGA_ILE_001]